MSSRFAAPSRVLLLLGLLAAGWAGSVQAQMITTPPPLLRVARAERPVLLESARVTAQVVGSLATSRVELVFRNPNDRVLEGELSFPLAEGQSVLGFALEAPDGQMLPAVPVEKARGRQVFESIVRRGADPALLERTQGNNFRLRVYPLPAGKTRRVSLEISEVLRPDAAGRVVYRPPLVAHAGRDTALALALRVPGLAAGELKVDAGPAQVRAEERHGAAWLDWAGTAGGAPVRLAWPLSREARVFADRHEGESYFHADIPVDAAAQARPAPRRVVLVWDASGSGAARDHAREFALLDGYFRALGEVEAVLVVARDEAEPARPFSVRGGDWGELRRVLESLPYDGASRAAAWAVPAALAGPDSVALLFSDGLANWGEPELPARPAGLTLYTVQAAAQANPARLRALAEAGEGGYLDLTRLEVAQALAELRTRRPRLLALEAEGADQLERLSSHPEDGRLVLAGRITGAGDRVTAILQGADGRRQEVRFNLPAAAEDSFFPAVAARRWAALRLARLEAEPELHRAGIRRLGERFGLVSGETSLLALESLEDYLRHDIQPPPGGWRDAFLQRRRQAEQAALGERSRHLDDLARRYGERVAWWEKDFPKDTPPQANPEKKRGQGAPAGAALEMREDTLLRPALAAPPAPAPEAMPPDAVARTAPAGNAAPAAQPGAEPAAGVRIQLQPWQPDAPYARRLRQAGDAERYAVYLDERPGQAGSTAFFLDAAGIFLDKGQPALARRILSSLAEMDLENRGILRILAYRLQQMGQVKLALPLFRRVRELAPDEPQSWRDLGLALAADGQHQAALEALWETAARPWDGRFADIDLIALAELNALLARVPGLDTRALDPRLIRNLPLDLRAVLTWDADDTDIDLWVIDPNGEKAYYGHPLSYQGGRMSRDFTAGYGPEEFALRHAKPGRYEVRAQFYGHRRQGVSPYTTLMLRLTSGFGTPAQKDEDIILRLSGQKEEVRVGSFEVGGGK